MTKWIWITLAFLVLTLLLSPLLFRRRKMEIVSEGKSVAEVKLPFTLFGGDCEWAVKRGKTNLFKIWGDSYDFPLFIYPFKGGDKFLCIDDDDTAVLVFTIDFDPLATNQPKDSGWPEDDSTRSRLYQRATNIVIETTGYIRLPNKSELTEASNNIVSLSSREFRARSMPVFDLGIYRHHFTKEFLLQRLDKNRRSAW